MQTANETFTATPEKEVPVNSGSESGFGEKVYEQRLHRSATDRVVAGVCGGLAEYLAVDPSLVRIAFVVGTLWGVGLLIYIVLAIILPVETSPATVRPVSSERTHVLTGTLLVVLGALLLAGNMGWTPWLTWNVFWPAVLVLVGIGLLARGTRTRPFM